MSNHFDKENPQNSAKHEASKAKLNQQLDPSGSLNPAKAQASNPLQVLAEKPLWELAFRPWFIASAVLSVLSMLVWVLYLHGKFTAFNDASITPVVWHIHEMLFGFGASVAVGFILTAAQTWTKQRSINGIALIVLTLIWLSVRVLLWGQSTQWLMLAVVMQALWWLISIGYIASMVFKAKNKRNYQFIPLLLVMMGLNLAMLLADMDQHTPLALHLASSMILLFTLLITIIGGRVIPFFTGRGATNSVIEKTPLLDKLLIVTTLIACGIYFVGYFYPLPFSPAIVLIMTGILHLARQYNWNPLATLKVPLLWSLHGSYTLLGLGLIALGVSYYTASVSFADALHIITIGTIGAMILAMFARVSLGHTGRALKPRPIMSLAFALILIGALARFILSVMGQPVMAWDISGLCWIVAFSLFVWVYTPILIRARADK